MRKGWSKKAIKIIIYGGHRYRLYKGRKYFEASPPRGGYLHRHVWEDNRGLIPVGHDIHHKDENTLNNEIDNLECITKCEHRRKHPMIGDSLERQKAHLNRIRKKANAWHKTEAGRAAARLAAKASWGPDRKMYDRICRGCGKNYKAPFANRGEFCSRGCRKGK